jgi:hypothetical protein
MRRLLISSLLASVLITPAAAFDLYGFHPFVGGGLTYGGSTVATVQFTNGDSQDLHAGSLATIYGGLEYRLADRVSLQGTIGYQADESSGRNGHLLFDRFPLEVLGHFHATQHFRFGGGLRYAIDPRLSGGGVLHGEGVDFNSSLGFVLEGEYLPWGDTTSGIGVKLRGVSERYKAQPTGQSFSGDQVGVLVSYYF